MSYHVPLAYRRRPAPVHPPVMPLAEVSAPAPGLTVKQKIAIAIAVVVVIAAILWWIERQRSQPKRRRRRRKSKQSTAEMARNLYKRLNERGDGDDRTMRALARIGDEG